MPDETHSLGGWRISVHGASGSGKSTLARTLARELDIPYLELDGLHHQANWSPLDTEEFRARVAEFVSLGSWVSDGNYREVRDLVWPRSQAIILIDLERRTVIWRLLGRAIRRSLRRSELWNGNREKFTNLLRRDEDRNVLLWSWRTHGRYRHELPDEARAQAPHARLFVLRSAREVVAFVDSLTSGGLGNV